MKKEEIYKEYKKALSFSSIQVQALFTFGTGCVAFYNLAYQFSQSMGLTLSKYEIALAIVSVLCLAYGQETTEIEKRLRNKNWHTLKDFLALTLKAGVARISKGIQSVFEIFSYTALMVPFFTILKKIFEYNATWGDIRPILLGIALSAGMYISSIIIRKLNEIIE